jgi:hypothetical protein
MHIFKRGGSPEDRLQSGPSGLDSMSMIHDPKRVERIRLGIANGLKRILALKAKVMDDSTGLREQLAQARNHFDDVELNYLSVLEKEERSSKAEARWLDSADMHLAVAINETDAIEKLIKGPKAISHG